MPYDIASLVPLFCEGFLGTAPFEEGEVVFREAIPTERMDYSIGSLTYLDQYLDVVVSRKDEVTGQDYTNTVLAAGCYLGEVIRRNTERNYKWVNYQDYFPARPKLVSLFPEVLGTSAILANDQGQVTLPINKVIRYIEEGSENNTKFYAEGELKVCR
jgi:hypothetical protein